MKPATAVQAVALPQDVQIIESIGITPEEYYDFLDQCEYACANRGQAYSHIPDIRNEPISTATLIQLAIGVALTVAGALLAPKPKSPDDQKQPPQLQTGDKTGKSKFTPITTLILFRASCPAQPSRWSTPETLCVLTPSCCGQHRHGAQRPGGQAAVSGLAGKLERYLDFDGIAIGDTLTELTEPAWSWFAPTAVASKRSQMLTSTTTAKSLVTCRASASDDVFSIQVRQSPLVSPAIWSPHPWNGHQFGLYNFIPNGNRLS